MRADQRRRAIAAEIAALPPALPGSLTARLTRCQSEGCHCRGEPPVLHGPYWAWTHRQGGRQVTRAITADQAERLRPFIDADRKLHDLVRELEDLAVKDLDTLTDGS